MPRRPPAPIAALLWLALPAALPAQTGEIDYAERWAAGRSFAAFLAAADRRADDWRANYAAASIDPPELLGRLIAVGGRWRLLAVAEAWCGDSVNTLPWIAHLAEVAPNLELVVAGRDTALDVMEAHRTPDGRAATPTVVLLDPDYREVGCWVERPGELQSWFLEHEHTLERDELYARKYSWYREDRGRHTLREIVERVEAAAAGRPLCAAGHR